VHLPNDWSPAPPTVLATLHCRDTVQIAGDALFAWRGVEQVVCLDTGPDNKQRIITLRLKEKKKERVSPVAAASLAFMLSPDGKWLACAAADDGPAVSGLWYGPLEPNPEQWKRVETQVGPRTVPQLPVGRDAEQDRPVYLYDLRPRLGAWSPNSKWLAYLRASPVPAAEEREPSGSTDDSPEPQVTRHTVVVMPVDGGGRATELPVPQGIPTDLHWSPTGLRLGFLASRQLIIHDASNGKATSLAGAARVETFIGWSAEGRHLAYLTPQCGFRTVQMALPKGHLVTWGPADRHNLVIAQGDGSHPANRFNGMNVTFARWAHKAPKLSFWATYLPTVNLLPPGDPAAVLDVEDNTVKWYPTDIGEYAQVGHYYLLNDRYEDALGQYDKALEMLDEQASDESLGAQLCLWRAVCRLGLLQRREAEEALGKFRQLCAAVDAESGAEDDAPEDDPLLAGLSAALRADRILLSTLLSMNQVGLAAQEAKSLATIDPGPRRLQAHCFLALIEQAASDADHFAWRVTARIIPEALALDHAEPMGTEALVGSALTVLLEERTLTAMSDGAKLQAAERLQELSGATGPARAAVGKSLARAGALLYRDLDELEREADLLGQLTAE